MDGYVFWWKANDSHGGSEENGQAGGFIGYNNEGLIETMKCIQLIRLEEQAIKQDLFLEQRL